MEYQVIVLALIVICYALYVHANTQMKGMFWSTLVGGLAGCTMILLIVYSTNEWSKKEARRDFCEQFNCVELKQ